MFLPTFSQICVGFIVAIGLLGNIYCIRELRSSKLKNYAFSCYLSALACSDTVFLLTVAWFNISNLGPDLINLPILCQSSYFLSYTASFLSNWYIAVLSFERFLAVHNPFRSYLKLVSNRFKLQVVALTVSGVILNSWTLVCFEIRQDVESIIDQYSNQTVNVTANLCQFRKSAEKYYKELNLFDSIVSCAIPLVIIFIFNCLVVRGLIRSYKSCVITCDSTKENINLHESFKSKISISSAVVSQKNCSRRRNNERKITILLLSISVTHLILNLPSYLHRMIVSFLNPIENDKSFKLAEQDPFEVIAHLIFYTQYSVNFILYSYNNCICTCQFKSKLLDKR